MQPTPWQVRVAAIGGYHAMALMLATEGFWLSSILMLMMAYGSVFALHAIDQRSLIRLAQHGEYAESRATDRLERTRASAELLHNEQQQRSHSLRVRYYQRVHAIRFLTDDDDNGGMWTWTW